MPSIVALTLCTIFVLFSLRLDRKQFPEASLSLWIPTIWFLLATSQPLSVWFGVGVTSVEEGSTIDRIVLILILFIGLIIIRKRNVNIIGLLRQNPSVILLIGFILISITWSDIPFVSFKRWLRELIPIGMALIIASEDDPRQSLQCIFRRMIYIHLPFSYILIHYYGHLGKAYVGWSGELMWTGVTTQKNGLTFLCTLSLFYFAWTFIRRQQGRDNTVVWYQKYIEIFIVLLSIWLFMGPNHSLTYSATSMVTLIIGLISFVGFLWLKKHNIIMSYNTLTIVIAEIIIYGTFTPFMGRLTLFDPSGNLNRDSTLTGRSEVWADLIPYAMQKPILGHGWGGFWTNNMRHTLYFPAHNGYLETILDTGFIGLFFLSIFLISNCRKAQQLMNRDFDWAILWFCILLIAVTRNITESINSLENSLISILVFMSISFASENSFNK
jgi:O-antigen ligase